ncbi:hypothetical protein RRG38_04155 [Mycoplasmopsis felis]|uniref:hypothetical protein n=1 Tax=Mycoplasmopsis felis TaxID=33923 RepID=UPI002AF6C8E0|nr:hypothetical protein [Mycoplasmopsis felis]WQQ02789.1 hypothetical protein RNN91_01760 [Mycoplasmopsis felis]
MRNCTLKTVIYLNELDIYRKLFQDEKNNKDKISWLNREYFKYIVENWDFASYIDVRYIND